MEYRSKGSAPFVFFVLFAPFRGYFRIRFFMRVLGLTAAGTAPAADLERRPE